MIRKVFLPLTLCMLISFVLVGCSKTIDIKYDKDYGVRYDVSDNDIASFVLIKIDPEHEDVVSDLRIWVELTEEEYKDKELVKELQMDSNSNLNMMNDSFSTYFYQEGEEYSFEVIDLQFYKDDELESTISEEARELLEYVGLTDELSDNVLYYEEELLKSDSFKYKWIIDNGTFDNNISFLQLEEYEYPRK
ncbi:MAG: hypothetical protein E7191_03830 [Erysipelotrichaceae bacterium]|nr:hypothetical protein [Erysipelotrichaceae bacterium]